MEQSTEFKTQHKDITAIRQPAGFSFRHSCGKELSSRGGGVWVCGCLEVFYSVKIFPVDINQEPNDK